MTTRPRFARLALLVVFAVLGAAGCTVGLDFEQGAQPSTDDTTGDITAPDSDTADSDAADSEDSADSDTADTTPTDTGSDTTEVADVDDTCDPACGTNEICTDPLSDTCECADGFADCDGDATHGCETDLTTIDDCGSCGNACAANEACGDGTCDCAVGFDDCDGDATNGCEQPLDVPEHCGTCDPGNDCEIFGFGQCEVLMFGETGTCVGCAEGYLDLDTASNDCETGLLVTPSGAQTLDLLPSMGVIVALEHDGATLFAVSNEGAKLFLHAITIDAQGNATVVGTVDTNTGPGASGQVNLGVYNGFVALAVQGAFAFYEFDGTQLNLIGTATSSGASAMDALAMPARPSSQAEFLAGHAGGITWYGVVANTTDAPVPADCLLGDRVCPLATRTNPSNVLALTAGWLGSTQWAVVAGDSTSEATFNGTTPALSVVSATGDPVPGNALGLEILPGNRLGALQSDGLHIFNYTIDSASQEPESRDDAMTITPTQGDARDFAMVDMDRLLLATSEGLVAVRLNGTDNPQALVTSPLTQVDAVAVAGTQAFAASGQTLVVLDIDLKPFE